jgi:hypothetical protein
MKGLKETMGLAGTSIGFGIVGTAFGSTGLTEAGQVTGKFIPISANISGASMTLDMLKKIK